MRLTTRFNDVNATKELEHYIRRRAAFSLGRFATEIHRVAVTVTDVNGPRGGDDKVCKISIHPRGGSAVFASSSHVSEYGAIYEALQKVERALRRKRERSRIGTLGFGFG